MRRGRDGNYIGHLTDDYGWVTEIRAAMSEGPDGKKCLLGHGRLIAGPREAEMEKER